MSLVALHLIAILAAVVVAFGGLLGLCAIAGCVLSSRISEREEREAAAMLAERRAALTTEPDPIESYPSGISDIENSPVEKTPIAPFLVGDMPFPAIVSPLTNRYVTPEVSQ